MKKVEENIKFVYGLNGSANAVVKEAEGNFRVRVETLILKDDKVMINNTQKLNQYGRLYKIPGGSIEPGLTLEESAAKECREEVRANVVDLKYCCKIKNLYKEIIPEWHKRLLWPLGLKYVGSLTYVFVAQYKDYFDGFIKEQDQELEMLEGCKFYNIDEIENILCNEHKEILKGLKKE